MYSCPWGQMTCKTSFWTELHWVTSHHLYSPRLSCSSPLQGAFQWLGQGDRLGMTLRRREALFLLRSKQFCFHSEVLCVYWGEKFVCFFFLLFFKCISKLGTVFAQFVTGLGWKILGSSGNFFLNVCWLGCARTDRALPRQPCFQCSQCFSFLILPLWRRNRFLMSMSILM